MEVWGGLECTLNRVHDEFLDQHTRSGHRARYREDLQLIASLGIRTLRTALHWEYFEANGRSWAFFDGLLGEMQRLQLTPIAGLVHHGSGPAGTSLLDPEFPALLAAYAGQVARRYPWITRYTPVNEPHTTSRFSCLYEHWYPHGRSVESYLRALLHEVKGTVLAMRAIREVQPEAQLIYTEDGGTVFARETLESYRVKREARRWLGIDLLCGRVGEDHELYADLRDHGFGMEEILWFQENQCPPSVIGFNYYPTSDRFLDDRLALYPESYRGGDTRVEPLVDIEAVRVHPAGIAGVGAVLREAWERYGLPVAITEAHLGGGSEDQMRWLREMWTDAQAARASGVNVVAMTIWALLGSWNWPNLCTQDLGLYEPGVFCLVDGERQRTPLADFVARLTNGELPTPELPETVPWWRRPDRITFRGDEA